MIGASPTRCRQDRHPQDSEQHRGGGSFRSQIAWRDIRAMTICSTSASLSPGRPARIMARAYASVCKTRHDQRLPPAEHRGPVFHLQQGADPGLVGAVQHRLPQAAERARHAQPFVGLACMLGGRIVRQVSSFAITDSSSPLTWLAAPASSRPPHAGRVIPRRRPAHPLSARLRPFFSQALLPPSSPWPRQPPGRGRSVAHVTPSDEGLHIRARLRGQQQRPPSTPVSSRRASPAPVGPDAPGNRRRDTPWESRPPVMAFAVTWSRTRLCYWPGAGRASNWTPSLRSAQATESPSRSTPAEKTGTWRRRSPQVRAQPYLLITPDLNELLNELGGPASAAGGQGQGGRGADQDGQAGEGQHRGRVDRG